MMLVMQILAVLGVALVIYAVFGVSTVGKHVPKKHKILDPVLPPDDPGKEQKIQRLQSQVAKLESQLEEAQAAALEKKSGALAVKDKEEEFSVELKRREEWVAKAEAELAKIKSENSDLNNKFLAKEKELQEEFTKNVNLTRELRESKAALEAKEMACRLKEDQLQAQKHQSQVQLQTISDQAAKLTEFSQKEKNSEWVPKQEFNQLNEEYTKLEKDFEASQERLKNFAAEIAHLRQSSDQKTQVPPENKLPVHLPKENQPAAANAQVVQPPAVIDPPLLEPQSDTAVSAGAPEKIIDETIIPAATDNKSLKKTEEP